MKGKRLLSLVISAAMTLTMFSGFAVTSASAAVGDAANEIWNAATYDGAITADTTLYDGDKGTLITKFDMTKYTTYKGKEEGSDVETDLPVSETVGERTFSAYYSHPSMNGGYQTSGAYRDNYMTMFTFTPKADGVLTLYLRNVGSSKYVAILKEGAKNYKAISTDGGTTGSLVWQLGTGASASYSAQLTADTTYLMFVDGSKGQFMAVDYEEGATYTAPTAEPLPTNDPEALSWTAGAKDKGIAAGTTLMKGLMTLFADTANTGTYITCGEDFVEESETGAGLKYTASADGYLTVSFDGIGATKTVYIKEAGTADYAASYAVGADGKESPTITAAVTSGKTYYIAGAGTKARFASVIFSTETPATDAPTTDAPTGETTNPSDPVTPAEVGISYNNGMVTVNLGTDSTVTSGVLIIASYDGEVLSGVETKPLTFTNGIAEVTNLPLVNGTKLMVWDSLNGMKPLCRAYTVTGSSVTPAPEVTTNPDVTTDPNATPGATDPAEEDGFILWRADDADFDSTLTGTGATVKGLTVSDGFGSNNKKVTYTHTNGITYTFTRQWKHGANTQTLTFTPEQACIVTVVFNGNGGTGREVNISQGGTTLAAVTSTDTNTAAAETVVADIEDPSAGNVVIGGGGSNKNISAIFVEYYDPTVIVNRKVSGNINYTGTKTAAELANTKLVFTSTKDQTRYEVPMAATYSVDLRQNRDYDITIETNGQPDETLAVALTTNSVSVAKIDKTFDITVADVAETAVSGDVVVHDVNNDGTSLTLSSVTLTFTATDVAEGEEAITSTATIVDNKLTGLSLMPNHTYTVTAANANGYELSPLSKSYTFVAGDTTPFKNILFNETVTDVTFASEIQVGSDKAYATVSDAITAIKAMKDRPAGEDGRVTVKIDPGTYVEQVTVDAPYVTLAAADASNRPTISFYYGIGYLYYSADGGYYSLDKAVQKTELGTVTRWGCTVRVAGTNFLAENIIFENSFNCRVTPEELADGVTAAEPGWYSDVSGKPDRTAQGYDAMKREAVERDAAFAGDAANYECYNCDFIGSQDTLYTGYNGYFKNCYIEGGTDYIFGGDSVVFEGCTLAWHGYSDQNVGGYITACKTSATPTAGTAGLTSNGYLFKDCTVTNSKYYPNNKFAAGSWGRNWGGDKCQVVFDGVTIADGVDAPGAWSAMGGDLSGSILYVNNVTKNGAAVDVSGTTFNPNGTMASKSYTVMDPTDYFGTWVPKYYTGEIPEVTEYVTTWQFGLGNGAANYNAEGAGSQPISIEGANNAGTTQTMVVDATSGKFNNQGRSDEWCQGNAGTTFTFPVVEGSVVTFGAYDDNYTLTIGETDFTRKTSYTVPAGVTSVTATVKTGGYISYIKTTTPAEKGKPSDPEPEDLTGTVTITGTAKFGETLTATVENSNVSDTTTYTYKWYRADAVDGTYAAIDGAAASTYTLTADDVNKYIKCEVGTTASGFKGTISGTTTAAVAKAAMTASISITGTFKAGGAVTASVTTNAGLDYTIQWQANTGADGAYEDIEGAASASYTIADTLVGKTLKCVVTSTSATVEGSVTSDATTEILGKDVEIPALTGTVSLDKTSAIVGTTITATASGLNDGATAQYTWKSSTDNGTTWTDAGTVAAYTIPTNAAAGTLIKCVVSAQGFDGTIESSTLTIALPDSVAVSGAITLTGIYKNTGNKVDNYKMTKNDLVLTFTPETGTAVTATLSGVQDGTGEGDAAALAYTADLKPNTAYTVSLVETEAAGGNTYILADANKSITTAAADVINAITATKTYTYSATVQFDANSYSQLADAQDYTITFGTANGITPDSITFKKSDVNSETLLVTAYGHNLKAFITDGSSDPWTKSTFDAKTQVHSGCNVGSGNQDGFNATDTNAIVAFQKMSISLASAPATVAISGTLEVNQTLTTELTPSDAAATYQWYTAEAADASESAWTAIDGATTGSLTLTDAQKDKYIAVKVTGTGLEGTATAITSTTVAGSSFTSYTYTFKVDQTATQTYSENVNLLSSNDGNVDKAVSMTLVLPANTTSYTTEGVKITSNTTYPKYRLATRGGSTFTGLTSRVDTSAEGFTWKSYPDSTKTLPLIVVTPKVKGTFNIVIGHRTTANSTFYIWDNDYDNGDGTYGKFIATDQGQGTVVTLTQTLEAGHTYVMGHAGTGDGAVYEASFTTLEDLPADATE